MGVEVRPFGVRCNIACRYCYQNPERFAGNALLSYDMEVLLEAIRKAGSPFTLFGGEPLLMPIEDIERLFKFGFELYGKNGIQTNGTLATSEHLDLFIKYKVSVGISIDGPDELNDIRWAGTLSRSRQSTAKTLECIEALCKLKLIPALIITLHRNNASTEHLPRMHTWIRYLESIGIVSARLHLLEVEDEETRARYALSEEENLRALLSFYELEQELKHLRFDVFQDMRNMLMGNDKKTTCIWHACDPLNTKAVRGIEGNGQSSNCGRTNKEGVGFTKADDYGFERYLALYQTPQEFGGCQNCSFFLMCKGQCPGTSVGGDWRNRTEHCGVLMGMYRRLESELLEGGATPLSVHPDRKKIEQTFLEAWTNGRNATIDGLWTPQPCTNSGQS